MKHSLPVVLLWLLALLAKLPGQAQALDPSFAPLTLYGTAITTAAVQQTDGSYIVAGNFIRVNGVPAASLVRLTSTGLLDATFNCQNTGASIVRLAVLPSGQVLAFSAGSIVIGGQSYANLVKLNTNGTVASGYATGTGASGGAVRSMLLLPTGKVVLAGGFTSFNGTPAPGLVRLNTDGSVDQAFTAALGTGISGGDINVIALEPTGSFLVGGTFTNFNGSGRQYFIRLTNAGILDASYAPYSQYGIYNIALDPVTGQSLVRGGFGELVRVNTDGSTDQTFAVPSTTSCYGTSVYATTQLVVDQSRRVLLARSCVASGTSSPGNEYLTRFLPSGAIDPQLTGRRLLDAPVHGVLLQANGQIVLNGSFSRFGTTNTSLVRLGADGQADADFRPALDMQGWLSKIVRQPDGKILAIGSFREVNGQSAANLLRLDVDGTPDATFGYPTMDSFVNDIALQPDGKILLAGGFTTVADQPSNGVARLLPSGRYDTSFSSYASSTSGNAQVLAVQPDGGILVGGLNTSLAFNGRAASLHRLLPSGQPDATYAQAIGTGPNNSVDNIAVLADGRHYIGGYFNRLNGVPTESVVRLLATGQPDPSFVLPSTAGSNRFIDKLLPLASGELLIGGSFTSYAGMARTNLVRLNANGSVNATFNANLVGSRLNELFEQPNGKILVGTSGNNTVAGVNRGGFFRLNPDGTYDNSLAASPGFIGGAIASLAVQPDGKVVVAGSFAEVNGQLRSHIARLMVPNVLYLSKQQSSARTEAWPNPAHETLQIRLEVSAGPSRLTLLDALGRTVLSQPVTSAELTLPVQHLPAGVYLLRVQYADGPVTRRVVVE